MRHHGMSEAKRRQRSLNSQCAVFTTFSTSQTVINTISKPKFS
jgi:hypothetical protein